MIHQIRKILREKGQGLTEYVLILAFIAGIAFMIFGGNGSLKGTVVGTFSETVRILGGLFDEKTDWGHADPNTFGTANSAERLAYDQNALANLADFFIGKTRKEISDKWFNQIQVAENDGGIMVGWFQQNDDKSMKFVPKFYKAEANSIFDLMQGGSGDATKYDSTNQYLVSDYVRYQFTQSSGDGAAAGNGVRIKFEYDKSAGANKPNDWVVTKVIIANDRNSQNNSGINSAGLEMTVTSDHTRTPTSTQLKN